MIKRTYETDNLVFYSQDEDGDYRVEIQIREPAVYVTREELKDIRAAIDELLSISSQ